MVNMFHHKIRVNDFKSGDFGAVDKEHGKQRKNSKMWNCERCWTKMIRKHKNNSPGNWALVNKLFPICYEIWKRFRIPLDGDYIS